MLTLNDAAHRARWQVLWLKDGRIVKHDFEHDLHGATQLYLKVRSAGRKGATLRCANMGFPPPEKLLPRVVKVKQELDTPRIVRRQGKRYRQTHTVKEMVYQPLKKLNRQGIFWCPYCMELRRFVHRNGFRVDGIYVAEKRLACPMCRVTQRDANVIKYNPMMAQIRYEMEERHRRSSPRTKESRQKARRRQRSRRKE